MLLKRIYTLLILCFCVLGTFMAQGAVVNGINYKLKSANMTAEVSGSNCVKGAVEIPESIIVDEVSYKVTSIEIEAFSDCNELTSITIGRNVTKIALHAFKNCSALNSITIPNSVTLVWNYAFEGCSSLTKVNYLGTMDEWLKIGITIPTPFDLYLNGELLTNVKMSSSDNTFSNCKSIKSVEIGNSVTYIDKNAFSGCIGLTAITIPNHVTSIGYGAFSNCSSLASITIPNSVTSIGNNVFSNCSGLTKVNYLGSVDEWLDLNFAASTNNPTYYAKDLYINGKLLIDVKISSADSIKNFAFDNCKSIKSVEIGNSVTHIDKNAFSGCSGLTSVTWNIKNYPGFIRASESPFYGFNVTSFTFGNEVERVPAYICYGQEYLKEVTIGTNVISIGSYAFKNCLALTSVVWNAKNCQDFSSYMDGPFYPSDAKNITLVLGTEVEHIPLNLCSYNNFSKVNYLGSVNKWVDLDFNSQGSNPTYYTKDLYINGELLTDVKISSADSIKKYAFYNCKSIKSLEIGKSVTSIGESAFSGCTGLVKVNYLGSVDRWAQINFASLYANPTYNTNDLYIDDELLTEVRISSVDNIKKYAFYNCKSLKNVEMSDTLTTVDEYAFYNCSDLTSVSIGKGVTIIGNNAFNNCSNLDTIVSYPTAVPTAYNNSFKNYNATLYVPCDAYDNYTSDDVFGTFKVINCVTAEEEGGTTPTPDPTPNPSGEITLYYVNNTNWATVYAYVWPTGGEGIFAWPGAPATKTDMTVNGYDVYSYTFESTKADNIIFNNGSGGSGNQTSDLLIDVGKHYFYDGAWYASLNFDAEEGGTGEFDDGIVIINGICYELQSNNTAKVVYLRDKNGGRLDYSGNIEIPSTITYKEKTYSVTTIGANAFLDSELTEIEIPATITTMESDAFWGANDLTSINYLGTVDQWAEIEFADEHSNPMRSGATFYIKGEKLTTVSIEKASVVKQYAFTYNSSIISVKLGNSVIEIQKGAFEGATNIERVEIGENISSIGNSAFRYINALSELTIHAVTVPTLASNWKPHDYIHLYVPCESLDLYKNALYFVYEIQCISNEGDGEDPENPDGGGNTGGDVNVSIDEVYEIKVYANNGTIYSEVEFEIYDLAGINITSQNGSLQGVYIVKTEKGNRLISVW